jgi:hypothetical protein
MSCTSFFCGAMVQQAPKDLIVKAACHNISFDIVLADDFDRLAQERNPELNGACFDRTFIRDSTRAGKLLGTLGGKKGVLTSGVQCTFLDRNSDTLLVIGTGFPVPRERMLPFVKIFPAYDIMLFDYRGIGSDHELGPSSLLPWKWKGIASWYGFNVDINVSGLGTVEEKDVIALVNESKQLKAYKHVYGLGQCFSSYVFAKALCLEPELFEKVIFDGSWPSLQRVIKTIIKNPSLLCEVKNPRSPMACLTSQECFQDCIQKLVEWGMWIDVKTARPMAHFLPHIQCPILFFQSLDDCYCNAQEFNTLWESTTSDKVAVFTHNLHGRNHTWQPEAYKEIATMFFDSKLDVFCGLLSGFNLKRSSTAHTS